MARNSIALLITAFAAGGLVAGCGGPKIARKPPSNVVPGPHGGPAYLLPESAGYVEIANEPPVDARSDDETSLILYFLGPDAKTSLRPTPADVQASVWYQVKLRKVRLEARPVPSDPAGAARFATPPGPFSLHSVRGSVTATIGGRRVSKQFSGMR